MTKRTSRKKIPPPPFVSFEHASSPHIVGRNKRRGIKSSQNTYILLMWILVIFIALSVTQSGAENPKGEALVDEMDAYFLKMKNLQGTLTMKMSSKDYSTKVEHKFYFAQPNLLKIVQSEPESSILTFDGKTFWEEKVAEKTVYRMELSAMPDTEIKIMGINSAMGLNKIGPVKDKYNFVYAGTKNYKGKNVLVVEGKGKDAKDEKITILIDAKDRYLVRMEKSSDEKKYSETLEYYDYRFVDGVWFSHKYDVLLKTPKGDLLKEVNFNSVKINKLRDHGIFKYVPSKNIKVKDIKK